MSRILELEKESITLLTFHFETELMMNPTNKYSSPSCRKWWKRINPEPSYCNVGRTLWRGTDLVVSILPWRVWINVVIQRKLSGDWLRIYVGHSKCVEFIKKYNLPLLILGGGGYTIRNVARCWTLETAVALGVEIANELPYNDYFEYFGPDFKLHISPSNMANQNTPEYLDKIRTRLFENLRMLPCAPGVQMQSTSFLTTYGR